jgi:hypothetical protein
VLRSAALLSSAVGKLKLKMVEEKHGDYKLVTYRFPENESPEGYEGGLQYNYSPCFVAVGNQFVASSTIELAHELVDLLIEESKTKAAGGPQSERTRIYSSGGADYLGSIQDILLTQTILDRGVAPETDKAQVKSLVDWVRKLGVIQIESLYEAKEYHYDIRLIPGKN